MAERSQLSRIIRDKAEAEVASALMRLANDLLEPFMQRWGLPLWDHETLEMTEEGFQALEWLMDPSPRVSDLPSTLVEAEEKKLLDRLTESTGHNGNGSKPSRPREIPEEEVAEIAEEAESLPWTEDEFGLPEHMETTRPVLAKTKANERLILSKVQIDTTTGCWKWRGSGGGKVGASCYIMTEGMKHETRRVMLWMVKGFYTPQSPLVWTCKKRDCVNPDHWKESWRFEEGRKP